MTVSLQPATASGNALSFRSAVVRFGRGAWANTRSAVKALQMGRMMATLSSMSDQQLAQIGISRSDIPQYAKTLMSDE